MEFFGRVEHREALRSGISKATGNEWKSTVVVFQDPNSRKAVAVSVFGEHNIEKMKPGEIGTVTFSSYVREYQDKNGVTRYNNELSLDSWEPIARKMENDPFQQAQAPQPQAQAPAPQPQTQAPAPQQQPQQVNTDLPF